MPNWVNNKLRVEKKYLNQIINNERNIDFNIAIPMPESLNVRSGGTNDSAMYVYLSNRMTLPLSEVDKIPESSLISNCFSRNWLAEIHDRLLNKSKTTEEIDELYKEGKILISNFRNYGAMTWYEWHIDNWGCKWNACESKITEIDDNTVMCSFDTPWSAPDKWLEELAKRNIPFHCEWIEEQGYHGEFISDGIGKLVENDLPMVQWNYEE